MYVVGAHGYVGSRVMAFAAAEGIEITAVSRAGDTRHGISSISWTEFLARIAANADRPTSIVWILDGAKHHEQDRLSDLLARAGAGTHVAAASSCTVYGNRGGDLCDEDTPLSLVTANARLKAACEQALAESPATYSALRLGALYGFDDRGVRTDRIQKWVTEAAQHGTVTVPDPVHWRGWLHRDQAARALLRAADQHITGTINIASSNYRFGEAAAFAADLFGADVIADGKEDPMDYQINSTKAVERGLLDQLDSEDLRTSTAAFAEKYAVH